jgi:SPASM domain peptide maturase of grasp-with-spasm system
MQNNCFHFIPNSLYDLLETYNGKTIESIKQDFNHEYDAIIDEYFDFLIANQLIFFNPNPDLFPKINTEWSSPSPITNAIVDHDTIIHDFNSLLPQFEMLKCSYIQLRFYSAISLGYILEVAQMLKEHQSRIVSVDFILPFYQDFDLAALQTLVSENSRIHSVILFDAPEDISHEPINDEMGYIMQVRRNVLNEKHCGLINNEYFYSNIKLYAESQQYNTCLNRKIAIDRFGDIKNCPSMRESFGNINDTTLGAALSSPGFKKYWTIGKDQVSVCKDCEFRHVCTDCRAYTEEPGNAYAKPLKCGYDPYTNEWSEWSTNPLKQKAIAFYGMQELTKKDA